MSLRALTQPTSVAQRGRTTSVPDGRGSEDVRVEWKGLVSHPPAANYCMAPFRQRTHWRGHRIARPAVSQNGGLPPS